MAADLQTPASSVSFLSPEKIPENNAFQYQGDLDKVKRQLGRQHLQMIAIAGCIGTGLFYGLGEILALCGPLGALLVYLHVSTVVYGTIMSIGEMAAYAPISGSVVHYTARWLDPAAGFALGWNYCYSTAISIPLEITALTAFVSFWDSNSSHAAIYIAATIVGLFVINLFGVRWFGNSEILFATLKIMLAITLIIGGLVIDLGGGPDHDRIGFRYWIDPGPMVSTLEPGALGRFIGLLVAIVPAAFSVSGFELIAIGAAESVQPRTNIIRAMKFVVFRLVFFYLCSVIIVGMLIPSNYPDLLLVVPKIVLNGNSQSPFVIAFERAGINVLPSIINAIIISSAYSTANTCVFTASRILYGLAVQKQAPKIFATCTKGGVPWVAVIIASLFSFLAFMTVSSSASTVFNWFVSLSTMCGLIGYVAPLSLCDRIFITIHRWTVINTTYLRYYYGLKLHGIVPRGIYRSPLQPYAAMWAIFWSVFYMLISGISVFWNFNASSFIASYINLPIILCLFIGYKLWYKTKIQPLAELDFTSHIPTLEETGDEGLLLEKVPFLQKLGIV
ncbi:general amino acid permease [Pisolithus marmoratus]|nr:general amino acid permease [Pisolithus marmoratus]